MNRYYQMLALSLMAGLFLGCRAESDVASYTIPKERSGLDQLRKPTPPITDRSPTVETSTAASAKEADRMVVAIADRSDATWFFKLTGPVSKIADTERSWRSFLGSIRFEDTGKPKWNLPEGWSTGKQKPMRFATLLIDDRTPPLEIAVSSLSPGQDLLANVNRWRGQLGLDETTTQTMDAALKSIDAGGQKLIVFDETGKMSGGMMPPFARGGMSPRSIAAAGTSIKFDAPEGWAEGKPSPFLKARLTKNDGDSSVQISVSSLPASVNKWLPNVKRWAGQVGLSSLSDEELGHRTEEITVDGVTAKLIRLIPESKENTKATIAVMVKKETQAWFFKLAGDSKLVQDNDQVFSQFLKTVSLP